MIFVPCSGELFVLAVFAPKYHYVSLVHWDQLLASFFLHTLYITHPYS